MPDRTRHATGRRTSRNEITLTLDGSAVVVPAGTTVAALVLASADTKTSTLRQPGPWCGMGSCFGCRVTIDGRPYQRGCLVLCAAGMEVETDGG